MKIAWKQVDLNLDSGPMIVWSIGPLPDRISTKESGKGRTGRGGKLMRVSG